MISPNRSNYTAKLVDYCSSKFAAVGFDLIPGTGLVADRIDVRLRPLRVPVAMSLLRRFDPTQGVASKTAGAGQYRAMKPPSPHYARLVNMHDIENVDSQWHLPLYSGKAVNFRENQRRVSPLTRIFFPENLTLV